MKFGKVAQPELVDFSIPKDHSDTKKVFHSSLKENGKCSIYVGCAKWNRQDLKNFYPRGTKDELQYYSTQFNSIELNATFYRFFPKEQFVKWKEKAPNNFKFFPKINQEISHFKQLNQVSDAVNRYVDAISHLEDKLGTIFLQMHERFSPARFNRLKEFVETWPKGFPLAIELRHQEWYQNEALTNELCDLLASHYVGHILVDTAGRRDMMHMRMTNSEPFVRWVGANHESDYKRIEDWVTRIEDWVKMGMTSLHFFVHQNHELESPLLAGLLVKRLNEKIGVNLTVPSTSTGNESNQLNLL